MEGIQLTALALLVLFGANWVSKLRWCIFLPPLALFLAVILSFVSSNLLLAALFRCPRGCEHSILGGLLFSLAIG